MVLKTLLLYLCDKTIWEQRTLDVKARQNFEATLLVCLPPPHSCPVSEAGAAHSDSCDLTSTCALRDGRAPHAHCYSGLCNSRDRRVRAEALLWALAGVRWDSFWRFWGCRQGKSISSKGQAEEHHVFLNDGLSCFREGTLQARGGEGFEDEFWR